jgi:WhiB family redox-sensing transcriptional regulator
VTPDTAALIDRRIAQPVRSRLSTSVLLLLTGGESLWRLRALCRTHPPELFYPPDHARGRVKVVWEAKAKQICARCPVIAECRSYAIGARELHGIWGGTSPQDRNMETPSHQR